MVQMWSRLCCNSPQECCTEAHMASSNTSSGHRCKDEEVAPPPTYPGRSGKMWVGQVGGVGQGPSDGEAVIKGRCATHVFTPDRPNSTGQGAQEDRCMKGKQSQSLLSCLRMKAVQLLLCLTVTCGAQKPSRWDAKGQGPSLLVCTLSMSITLHMSELKTGLTFNLCLQWN